MASRPDATAHFIEQMIPHHLDAIAMAKLASAQAEHPQLKALAAAITRAQSAEIARMRVWYRQWYGRSVPQAGTHSMGTDLAALDGAKPFDREFIEQMVPHHRQAVMMARMALQHGAKAKLEPLLRSIIKSQSAEIAQMARWYRQWYGKSLPASGGHMHGMSADGVQMHGAGMHRS